MSTQASCGEGLGGGLFCALRCAEPHLESQPGTVPFFTLVLWGCGHEPRLLSNLDVWVVEALNIRVLDVGSRLSPPWGEAGSPEFPTLFCVAVPGAEITERMCLRLPYPLLGGTYLVP